MEESGVDFSTMEETLNNLGVEVNKIYNKTEEGMVAAMLDTLRRAMKLAPIVSGNLRASGFVIWGKRRSPKVAANFVDSPYSGLTEGFMAAKHSEFIDDTRASIQDMPGLNKRQGAIGFSAIYALGVHENSRSGNTGGSSPSGKPYKDGSFSKVGQWKFLETPLKETNRILNIIKSKSGTK